MHQDIRVSMYLDVKEQDFLFDIKLFQLLFHRRYPTFYINIDYLTPYKILLTDNLLFPKTSTAENFEFVEYLLNVDINQGKHASRVANAMSASQKNINF